MEWEDWEGSSGENSDVDVDLEVGNNDELYYTGALLSKLQFRSDTSKARWDSEMGMAEVVENKGKMWATTGIVRGGKIYCSIEETLFLAELGALHLMDGNDMHLSLTDIYGKIAEGKSGCCWELFEVYKHLKSLGYIVGRYGVPWTMKGVKSNCKSDSVRGTLENNWVVDIETNDTTSIIETLNNLQLDGLRPVFDVYLPNSKFRKSSPGDPTFVLCLIRGAPPSFAEIDTLERQCGGIPMKVCHVDHGRVSFFSFKRVELPVLP